MSAHKMIVTLFFLFLIGISGNICAQTFSSLPESERNAKLIEVAKYVYKNPRWKDFYREYGTPKIRSFVRKGRGEEGKDTRSNEGIDLGFLVYIVTFPYDETKESMEWGFAAEVYISDKGGFARIIYLGNGMGYKTYEMNKNPVR